MSKKNTTAKNVSAAAKKAALGKNHILYLKALSKKPLTRKQAWEATGLKDPSSSSQYIGRTDEETRIADEARHGYTSLLTMKLVKVEQHDIDGKDVVLFSLTAAGRKALEESKKNKG